MITPAAPSLPAQATHFSPDSAPRLPGTAQAVAACAAEALWLAALVAAPLFMNVAGVRTYEVAKLAALLPFAAMAWFVLLAARAQLPWPEARQLWSSPAVRGFCLLLAAGAISVIASETRGIAFFGDYFRREGYVSWLLYGGFFAIVLLLLRERAQLARLFDTLLVVSVAPCVYAIQQRFGFDFLTTLSLGTGNSDTRPIANLGNAAYLGAYLLMVIPVTIFRTLQERSSFARLPWMALAGLQLYVALLTQSRGPLLALGAALFLLTVLYAAAWSRRALVLAAFGCAGLGLAALVALNLSAELQGAAQGTLLQRFVLVAGGADTSTGSRAGIWQAGTNAFFTTSWYRMLFGAGPDAAHFFYFPHMPALVMHIEGYSNITDRLHNETLETLMTIGLAGLLCQIIFFTGLVQLVLNRMAGRAPGYAIVGLWLAVGGGGLAAAAGARLLGGSSAFFGIGFGLGIVLVWAAALILAAWRSLAHHRHQRHQQATEPGARHQPDHDGLLAISLVCALIGFWIDSQVGVPSITTRLLCAFYAAVVIVLMLGLLAPPAGGTVVPATASPKEAQLDVPLHGWVVALALSVLTAAYFPPTLGMAAQAPSLARLDLIIVPMAALLAFGGIAAYQEGQRLGLRWAALFPRFLAAALVPSGIFVIAYLSWGSDIQGAADAVAGERINSLLAFVLFAFMTLALVLALRLAAALPEAPARRVPGTIASGWLAWFWLGFGVVACAGVGWGALRELRADTYVKLAEWSQTSNRPEAADFYAQKALETLPQERRLASTQAIRLTTRAWQEVSQLPPGAKASPQTMALIDEARRLALANVERAPRDPWATMAAANVHQFLGLGMLETTVGRDARLGYQNTAAGLFEIAFKQFPVHPMVLRGWAQLEFDRGDRKAGYTRFDQMEQQDPHYPAVYAERLRFTKAFGDHDVAVAALNKGIAAQPAGSAAANQIRHTLARYLMETGQLVQALQVWLDAVATIPTDTFAAAGAVETHMALGQRDLAVRAARAALMRLPAAPDAAAANARERIEAFLGMAPTAKTDKRQ